MAFEARYGCPRDLQDWAKANAYWSCFCMICLDQIERTGGLTGIALADLLRLREVSQGVTM